MMLKKVELVRAENLKKEVREANGLDDEGLVIAETTNSTLKVTFKKIPNGGMRKYFESLGSFK